VALGAAFYYSPAGWQLRSRARWYAEDPWGGARVHLWTDSAAMAARRPLGYGPEVFTAAFPRFESAALAREYPDFLHESPHNIFLDAWVSQGIAGVLLLAGFCWIGLAAAWRGKQFWLAAAIAAIVVSQMFTVFIMPTALVFYVLVGQACSLQVGLNPARHGPLTKLAGWAAAAVLVYAAIRLTAADRALELAKQSLDRSDVAAAAVEYGSSSDLWYARACASVAGSAANLPLRMQAMLQASVAAIRATQTSEEPFNAWYNLSSLYAAQNDFVHTEQCLRHAIAARPNWFKPHWMLAQVLRLEGRLDEAEAEAAIAADRNGGKNPEVRRTLDEIRIQRVSGHLQPW